MKLVAAVGIALIIGAAVGFGLRGALGFRSFSVRECNGEPLRVSAPFGWSPHGLDLFVAGYASRGPVTLELWEPGSSEPANRLVLTPRPPKESVEFSRLGDWYSEAEIRLTAAQCQLVVFYRFRALP